MTRYLNMGYFALSANIILFMVFIMLDGGSALHTMSALLGVISMILVGAEVFAFVRSPQGHAEQINWVGCSLAVLVIVSRVLEASGDYGGSRNVLFLCLYVAAVGLVESIYRLERSAQVHKARSSADR